MGRYINWPDERREDKKNLARSLGAVEVNQEAAAEVVKQGEQAVLVWVDNGWMDALAYAYSEREFEAFTLPSDRRPKAYFVVSKEVAEANAK